MYTAMYYVYFSMLVYTVCIRYAYCGILYTVVGVCTKPRCTNEVLPLLNFKFSEIIILKDRREIKNLQQWKVVKIV